MRHDYWTPWGTDVAARSLSEPITRPPRARVALSNAGQRIASALEDVRHALAVRLIEAIAGWPKYANEIQVARANGEFDGYVRREFHAHVDYLALYFRAGDRAYRDLYIGEKIKQAYYNLDPSFAGQQLRRGEVIAADRAAFLAVLRNRLTNAELELVDNEFDYVARLLANRARHNLEVLLVGDCLFLDVMAFLPGLCLDDEIAVTPTFLASRNPAELRNGIRQLVDRTFDVVFYSPFTYEFALAWSQLLEPGSATWSHRRVQGLVADALDAIRPTLDLISDCFECNIFVHNAAGIRRHDGRLMDRLKNLLTWRTRRQMRQRLSSRVEQEIARINCRGFEHLFLFDELPLLEQHTEWELGRKFYDAELQHPAVFGKRVASEYRDLLAVRAYLQSRKLVVCDLDNTLWKGVIGEGRVEQHADRQRILKKLQARGVVLAICSKNDPGNVHWEGGVLCERDFVCAEINWDQKVANLARIARTLNLKTKDFVFVDDRADERALVQAAMPEIRVLDATAPRTWELLDLWARCLPRQDAADRTESYRQKARRDDFLRQEAIEDPSKMFAQLCIHVLVRDAQPSDVQRITELINRTNQFNTCGSRTTIREVASRLNSDAWRILLADAGDRFGSMGTVSIAVVHVAPEQFEIATFVLSCRVFGYGIETAVLNAVKRLAESAQVPVVGPILETPHNQPCRQVYRDSGFESDGVTWVWKPAHPITEPSWLTVTTNISPRKTDRS
jgi:FkbH-like protein